MPILLHDPGVAPSIRKRIESLRADTKPQWGKMTVDQMLWHVNVSLREAAGDYAPKLKPLPVPKALMRWAVLNMPWGKGAPTRPDMLVTSAHDFHAEKSACLALFDRIVARPLSAEWPISASLGHMTGKHWSQLTAKHLEHHLSQFGV